MANFSFVWIHILFSFHLILTRRPILLIKIHLRVILGWKMLFKVVFRCAFYNSFCKKHGRFLLWTYYRGSWYSSSIHCFGTKIFIIKFFFKKLTIYYKVNQFHHVELCLIHHKSTVVEVSEEMCYEELLPYKELFTTGVTLWVERSREFCSVHTYLMWLKHFNSMTPQIKGASWAIFRM